MIALLIAVVSLPPSEPVVDLVEINHYQDAEGRKVLDQLIFYSWSRQTKRYQVREWRLIKCDSMYPVQQGRGYVVRWHDDGVMREVFARAKRETVTRHDVEIREQKQLHQCDRTPLFASGE
jgi:hypothetical protein